MEAFDRLPGEISHLVSEFSSIPIFGTLRLGLTQYTFWLIVSSIVLLALVFAYVRRISLVPRGIFANAMEVCINFVADGMGKQIIGATWEKHFPFLATVFFFILVNNVVGVIPGMKPGSGTISTTAAIAVVVFIYFVFVGMRQHGVGGYLKSLAPAGVGFPLNVLVWLIELVSMLLRPITLAIRLFCNMFAGHIVMGSFALMVALFAEPLIQELTVSNALGAVPAFIFAAILFVIYAIEIFVAFVQAYVFTMLTAVYIQGAEAEGH
ncbi:F0F1 ATP synthase subunit A [Collinsella sp. AGMB00827]|uniref:ATP synthase subunit a n=1 Tax=Collinsella ureilytica TaxID=2869515 RepID=A0ABS7MJP7_9ACTN|nr:F0F1 ATP synthase subunit A [Collinsella urealyticum]